MTEDIMKNVMEETGLSVLDLLAATIDIARREYPSELVRRRDHIMQGLYGGVQCLECTDMGRDQLASTEAPVSDMETQTWNMDQGKSKFSDPCEVVVKGNSNQEQLPERRRPLRVVIRLKNNKNLSVEATERPKSNSHVTKATETKNSEMSKVQKAVPKKEDFTEKRFEDTKRKLRENYEMAACGECLRISNQSLYE
ncbi:hypothetical protein FCM35_KLT11554 [Carex littledalei]|uniref:Uncharacterized protein n=1 Tax=Carex littledalei TaxID=544730 RepID=A0A833V4V8_9POAL|nr:hypothetical protein FCM35_KLT11554 [Carex littledalei]